MQYIQMQLENLRNKLQFVIVLTLFFPVLLEALFNLSGKEGDGSSLVLKWGIVLVVLILDYLFVETIGKQFSGKIVSWSEKLLLLTIACFVPVIWMLSATQHATTISKPLAYGALVGSVGIMFLPVVILILFVGSLIGYVWRDISQTGSVRQK